MSGVYLLNVKCSFYMQCSWLPPSCWPLHYAEDCRLIVVSDSVFILLQSLAQVLREARGQNKKAEAKIADLEQKLLEAQGDIKVGD